MQWRNVEAPALPELQAWLVALERADAALHERLRAVLASRDTGAQRVSSGARAEHVASDARAVHVASDARALHVAADARALPVASDARALHVAADARALPAVPLVVLEAAAAQTALQAVSGHAVERGGLLVGSACRRGDAVALVHVRCAVASHDDEASEVSLRMDASVWSAARAQLRAQERVVGWFHSHPGIGAFFSDTDRRTQAAFFREPYSLGWVIDPVQREQAWFCGAQSRALEGGDIVAV